MACRPGNIKTPRQFDDADKEIQELLEKKCSCHNHLLAKPDEQAAKTAYKTACSTLQAKLRTMQNDQWTALLSWGRREGKQKRWEDSTREWTGLKFTKSQRAVENREE